MAMPPINAMFDNRNILAAHIRWGPAQTILYTIHTEYGMFGRRITTLTSTDGMEVGAILWRDRLFRVHGITLNLDDIRRNNNSLWVIFL